MIRLILECAAIQRASPFPDTKKPGREICPVCLSHIGFAFLAAPALLLPRLQQDISYASIFHTQHSEYAAAAYQIGQTLAANRRLVHTNRGR